LREEIASVRGELAVVRQELKGEIADLREGIVRMEARLSTGFADGKSSMIRWFLGIAVGLSTIVFAVSKFSGA
jgi:hypothetical protein